MTSFYRWNALEAIYQKGQSTGRACDGTSGVAAETVSYELQRSDPLVAVAIDKLVCVCDTFDLVVDGFVEIQWDGWKTVQAKSEECKHKMSQYEDLPFGLRTP